MKAAIATLALALMATGCLNSIFTKYQDNQEVSPGHKFEQPVLQTLQMFVGESAAFLFVFVRKFGGTGGANSGEYETIGGKPNLPASRSFILAIPALCDLCATTLMNLGLMYTPVSIYQMTRGALILFVALFSVMFLQRRINRVEWMSLCIVVLGIVIVGVSGKKNAGAVSDQSSSKVVLGVSLVLLAQVIVATQFVVEEHIVHRWTVDPLTLVGYEGAFGGSSTLLVMILGYATVGHGTKGPLDMVNAFDEFWSNPAILYSSLAIMVSIGCFNFLGITLTSRLSATARSTIDTCRTALVWVVSLALGWESFVFAQLVGFLLLGFGTLVFNGAINVDAYLPRWLLADRTGTHIIDVVDEQIERL